LQATLHIPTHPPGGAAAAAISRVRQTTLPEAGCHRTSHSKSCMDGRMSSTANTEPAGADVASVLMMPAAATAAAGAAAAGAPRLSEPRRLAASCCATCRSRAAAASPPGGAELAGACGTPAAPRRASGRIGTGCAAAAAAAVGPDPNAERHNGNPVLCRCCAGSATAPTCCRPPSALATQGCVPPWAPLTSAAGAPRPSSAASSASSRLRWPSGAAAANAPQAAGGQRHPGPPITEHGLASSGLCRACTSGGTVAEQVTLLLLREPPCELAEPTGVRRSGAPSTLPPPLAMRSSSEAAAAAAAARSPLPAPQLPAAEPAAAAGEHEPPSLLLHSTAPKPDNWWWWLRAHA
jgi:hypothetical protein